MSTALRNRLRFVALALALGVGCSTTQTSPIGALPDLPPDYVKVPHPAGLDRADLLAIFTDLGAPSPEELKDCDADFQKLRKRTNSRDEQAMGARELIRRDPVRVHWCFYGKLLSLDEQLKNDVYLDEKQRDVLAAYSYLTPISRAFMEELADTRYMRWAVHRYRRLSEYVFYRRLELTPRATEEMAAASNPFGMVRPNKESSTSVLTKYGIVKPDLLIGTTAPTGPVGDTAAAVAGDIAPAQEPHDPASPALDPAGDPVTGIPARDVAGAAPAAGTVDPNADPLENPSANPGPAVDPLLEPTTVPGQGAPGAMVPPNDLADPLVSQTQGAVPDDTLVERTPGSTALPGAVDAQLKAEAPKAVPQNQYQDSSSEASAILNGDSVVTPEGSSIRRRPATAPLRPFHPLRK